VIEVIPVAGLMSGRAAATAASQRRVVAAGDASGQVIVGVGAGDEVGARGLEGWVVATGVGKAIADIVGDGAGGVVGAGDAQPMSATTTTAVAIAIRLALIAPITLRPFVMPRA
jgi:hypothetical protein